MSVPPTQPQAATARSLAAIILAAGKGRRMRSDLPKVVHEVAGEPMVRWVVNAARAVGANPIVLVVGHEADVVRDLFKNERDIIFVTQEPQLGTGHAVDQARNVVLGKPLPLGEGDDLNVLVLAGDGPLIRPGTLRQLIETHRRTNAAATLATSLIPDPTGYGRIVRDNGNRFQAIVEHNEATPEQRAIREVNPSYYCFRAKPLFEMLERIDNKNASGEYYVTDVFGLLLKEGQRVEVIDAVPPEDVLSINDPQQLAEVDAILRKRLAGSPLAVGGGLGVRADASVAEDSCAPSPQPSLRGRGGAPKKVEVKR